MKNKLKFTIIYIQIFYFVKEIAKKFSFLIYHFIHVSVLFSPNNMLEYHNVLRSLHNVNKLTLNNDVSITHKLFKSVAWPNRKFPVFM